MPYSQGPKKRPGESPEEYAKRLLDWMDGLTPAVLLSGLAVFGAVFLVGAYVITAVLIPGVPGHHSLDQLAIHKLETTGAR